MLAKSQAGDIVLGESARFQLPQSWQTSFTELMAVETGWSYQRSGRPYPLYKYTGRWNNLA